MNDQAARYEDRLRARRIADHSYEPSNVEARFLCQRIRAEQAKAAKLRGELVALTTATSGRVQTPPVVPLVGGQA